MAEEKRQIRLVHQREGEGPLLIADIDQGVPREHLDEERGQEVYIPYDRLTFVMDGTAASVDRNPDIPGYIDLVPSDKVMLSKEQGTIARLEEDGLLEVVELPEGGVQEPEITAAAQDDDGGADGSGDVVVEGDNFESFSPDETILVLLEDANDPQTSQTFTADDAGVTFDFATGTLTVEDTAHGTTEYSGTNAAAIVTANRLDSDPFDITHT